MSSVVLTWVAGNVAFFRADPGTTHISSTVTSLTFSSLKQTSLSAKFRVFAKDDRWEADGDNRAQWTSQDTFGLGTSRVPEDDVNMKFDYFRFYNTANTRLRRNVFAGVGLHYSPHVNVEPGKDADEGWSESPYVAYSEANGLPLESQTSAGVSVNLRVDTRDSAINAGRGWMASMSYRSSVVSDGTQVLLVADDIGRHNTVKLAGLCLMKEIPTQTRILLATGRISSEMLQKAARMSAPILISRTSPSSLSIDMAERYGITLIGYARKHRFNIYTNAQRMTNITNMQG